MKFKRKKVAKTLKKDVRWSSPKHIQRQEKEKKLVIEWPAKYYSR